MRPSSLTLGAWLLGAAAAAETAPPTAAAPRASEPVRVDGLLDEAAWAGAAPIGKFVQAEPKEGAAPSEATEVRVLHDADNLYFGVVCHDRGGLVVTQLARDSDLEVDDRVLIVLEPFDDHRNGFFFAVNPAGARADGQIANNAEEISLEWDGIWEARTRRSADGWTAEIAIPFKTLRFKPGQSVWGLNVERQIKRLQEKDRWAAARRDVWISNLAEAGRLTGLDEVRQGRGLDIRPYASAGEEQGDGKFKLGLDVFKNLAPNLNASLTVNTDFAETEVDARQVNLTRFPLFFPEKRAFFLEGAGVYEVAGLGSQNEDLLPFFSRRIGLLEERTVPILAGAKVSGRVSNLNIGLLDVRTRRHDELDVDGQNLLAFRLSRNLFEQSWVGVIATRGNPDGSGRNTLVGADARFATSRFRGDKNLSLDLYVFRTEDAQAGDDWAAGFKLDSPNDLLDVFLSGKRLGKDFRPALGFVPRPGVHILDTGISFQPRPGRFGIRQFFFELGERVVTNLDNRVDSSELFTAPFNCVTESGEHLEWNFIRSYERLTAPFEIDPGVVIPPGSYSWNRYRVLLNSATKRPWVVDFALRWGDFYDGRLRTVTFAFTLKPSTHVVLGLETERNDVSLPQGHFHTQVLSARAEYNVSPDLTWANLVQYDSESRLLGVQSRFRWILEPGNDLFLVFQRGWFKRDDGAYLPEFDSGSAKLQYTIRL